MKRARLPVLVAVSVVLTGCQWVGQTPPSPDPSGSTEPTSSTGPTLSNEVGSVHTLWRADDTALEPGGAEAIDEATPDGRDPLLFTDADAWESWTIELPEALTVPATSSYLDFSSIALVVGFYDDCKMTPYVFDEGDGDLVFAPLQDEPVLCYAGIPTIAVMLVPLSELSGDTTTLMVRRL